MHEFLDRASKLYYEGKPIIKDHEYDALAKKHNYKKVGHTVTNGIKHYFTMRSLHKVYDLQDAPEWYSIGGTTGMDIVCSPKLDGAAVSLLYINGRLEQALTRGDGIVGKNITQKMKLLVPNKLNFVSSGIVQLTGEVVAPKEIPNARNYAAGALNLKSIAEFSCRRIQFVLYGAEPAMTPYWDTEMDQYSMTGFVTVLEDVALTYPTDGVVYRLNDFAKHHMQGFTSQHPRGSFALKSDLTNSAVTRLNNVTWQVGKSGRVSPVAILSPVKIGDAVISRCTLHNISIIDELNLEIGCDVKVIRSGEIIPQIVRRMYPDETDGYEDLRAMEQEKIAMKGVEQEAHLRAGYESNEYEPSEHDEWMDFDPDC